MPHEDGGAYSPVVATISLGAPIVLDIYEKRCEPEAKSSVKNNNSEEDAERVDDSRESGSATARDTKRGPPARWRILQEPRSLLITTGPAYGQLLHGISPTDMDEDLGPDSVANWSLLGDQSVFESNGGTSQRRTRISLTYRDVLKVSKVGMGILGVGRK